MTKDSRVKFLWQAACILPPINPTNKLLKSYYLTSSRNIGSTNYSLPKLKYGDAGMCSKCSSCWFDGNFSMQLISQKVRSSKATKLINAVESGNNQLSRKQKIRAKWYKKRVNSSVELLCKLCNNKTSVALKKPLKHKTKDDSNEPESTIENIKKKKKKKDKSAGLLIPFHLEKTANETPFKSNLKTHNKNKSNQVNLKQVLLSNRSKQSQKKDKLKPTTKTIVSRTQQKNSLIQLANLLKKSSTMDANNSRLKMLLK